MDKESSGQYPGLNVFIYDALPVSEEWIHRFFIYFLKAVVGVGVKVLEEGLVLLY